MSAHERAVHWLTERVEGTDAGYRRDVALTACEACREADRARRCLELLSLATFALRLRSRAGTGDRPDAVWRQGVRLGAVLLLTSLAVESAAGGWEDAPRLGLAALLAVTTGCAILDRRMAAVGLAAAAAIAEAVWVSHGVQVGAFVSACAVAIGGLAAGGHEVARRRSGIVLTAGAAMLVGLLSARVIGTDSAEASSVLVFAWIVPAVLLVAGWFDPRLAAAATTIVFARLAASGFGELGRRACRPAAARRARAAAALAGDGPLGGGSVVRDTALDTARRTAVTLGLSTSRSVTGILSTDLVTDARRPSHAADAVFAILDQLPEALRPLPTVALAGTHGGTVVLPGGRRAAGASRRSAADSRRRLQHAG